MIDYDAYLQEQRQRNMNKGEQPSKEAEKQKIHQLLGLDENGKVIPSGRQLERRMANRNSWVMEEEPEYSPEQMKTRQLLGLKARKIKVTKEEGIQILFNRLFPPLKHHNFGYADRLGIAISVNGKRFKERLRGEFRKGNPASEDILEVFSAMLEGAQKKWNIPDDFTVMMNKHYFTLEEALKQAENNPLKYRKQLVQIYSQLGLVPEGFECHINANFNPNEPRDKDGKWTTGGSSSSSSPSSKEKGGIQSPADKREKRVAEQLARKKEADRKDQKNRENQINNGNARKNGPKIINNKEAGFAENFLNKLIEGKSGSNIWDFLVGILGKNQVKLLTGIPYGPRTLLGDGFTYGNYGGGHYGSGQILRDGQEMGSAPPVDSMDELFMFHDYDYGDSGESEEKRIEADKKLIRRLRELPENPNDWQRPPENISAAKAFRLGAILYFEDRIKRYEKQ